MPDLDYESRKPKPGPRQWPGPVVFAVYVAAMAVIWLLWQMVVNGRLW